MAAKARIAAPVGKLMFDPAAPENGTCVFLSAPFRFFFSKDGQKTAPVDLSDSDNDGLPDFVAQQTHNLLHAYHVFICALGLPDLCTVGIFAEQGVRFIDVTLDNLPVQRGLASAKVQETTPPFLRGSAWDGLSLSLRLHRALPVQSLTPAHELFHLFQYASVPFQNIWFMEGLARHAQRWLDSKPLKQIPLPATRQALESVLGQWHEAEPFWNRLCALCVTPAVMTGSTTHDLDQKDELYPANPHLFGQHLLPLYLKELKRCTEAMCIDMPTRQLGPPVQWGGDERRSASNNRYLLRAIVHTVEHLGIDAPHPELEAFLCLLRHLDSHAETVQDEPEIQRLFAVLKKYKLAAVYQNNEQNLRCDAFDPITATLSIVGLHIGADVDNIDLSAFSAVRGLVGNLSITDCPSIYELAGFNLLVSVQGSVTIENTGVRQLNAAFASLARIKGTLRIVGNLQLTEINDFHALESIDNALHIEKAPLLNSLNAFERLTEIKKGSLSLMQATLLDKIHAFDSLKIAHDICLEHLAVKNIDFLKPLFDCNPVYPGAIKIADSSLLQSITGLDNLKSIEGDLTISQTGIRHINSVNMLERINGKLDISHNSDLNAINGFTSLNYIKNDLIIDQCTRLTSIIGFSNLAQVKNVFLNRLGITQADFLSCLFKRQPEFKGSIKITSCKLESVNCFGHLKSVGSSFYLHGNKLCNLSGLENLQTVGASLSLGSNRLTDISQLSKLTRLDGIINLRANHLTSLHGLENLTSIKTTRWNNEPSTIKYEGNKHFDGSPSLTDISALSNVRELGGNLIVHVDPSHSYDAMPVKGSRYYSNKITYLTHQTDETGCILPTFIEVQPIARPAPEEIKIALNNEPFLTWEPAQAERYECVNAKVFALSEATCKHLTMSLNIAAWLTNHFRVSRFRVHMAHMKLYVASANAFLYPDIFVTYSETVHQAATYMENPLLIVEVLSDTTQAYDRGDKFSVYRKISCLREYVLINPETLQVEIFRKNSAGHWELHELPVGLDLELKSLGLSIPATALYAYL